MIDEQIRDGDFVIVNEKKSADNGEMVIALIDGTSATVKKFYRERDGRIRLQPANETMNPIYVHENDVPYNVLHDQNYPSIGCWPCTSKVMPGEDPRSGRWRGREKKECGLHNLPTRSNAIERKKSENVQAG